MSALRQRVTTLAVGAGQQSAPAALRSGRAVLRLALLLLALSLLAWWGWPRLCLRQFQSAIALQDLKSAEIWLQRAEWLPPVSAEVAFSRVRLARRLSRTDELVGAIQLAQQRGVPASRLLREANLAAAAAGDLQRLEQELPSLLQAGDDLPEICEAYARGCILNYQLGEAERILELWKSDFPADPQPWFLQGRLQEHRSDLKQAADNFRKALELSPHHAAAACNLGRILLTQQQPAEALVWFQRAVQDLAEPQPALVGAARCQRELEQWAAARATLKLALARPQTRLVESYRLVGERSESALAQAPAERGQLEFAEEHFAEALPWFEQALEVSPHDWRTRYSYATALRQTGRKEDADREFEQVEVTRAALASCDQLIGSLQQNPANPDARYRIGMVLMEHVSPNQGLIWLNSVLTYDPHHLPTLQALAEYFTAHRDEHPEYPALAKRHADTAALIGNHAAGP